MSSLSAASRRDGVGHEFLSSAKQNTSQNIMCVCVWWLGKKLKTRGGAGGGLKKPPADVCNLLLKGIQIMYMRRKARLIPPKPPHCTHYYYGSYSSVRIHKYDIAMNDCRNVRPNVHEAKKECLKAFATKKMIVLVCQGFSLTCTVGSRPWLFVNASVRPRSARRCPES